MLAQRTFLSMNSGDWAAIGIWVTIIVYMALAVFAWRQINEARTLRRETTRPYMVAELVAKSFLVSVAFKNIGRTEARDVRIRLSDRFESTTKSDAAWQDSPAFVGTIPSLPPGHSIEFFLDSFLQRRQAGLPMEIEGTFSYADSAGRRLPDEPFRIDLDVYGDANTPDKNIADVADELKRIREAIIGWANQGLHVQASDKDKADRATWRNLTRRRIRRSYDEGGIRSALTTWWQQTSAARLWRQWRN